MVGKANDKGVSLPRTASELLKNDLTLPGNHNKDQRQKNLAAIELFLTESYEQKCGFVLVIIPKKYGPLYAQVIPIRVYYSRRR